jgi:hypothetical protein
MAAGHHSRVCGFVHCLPRAACACEHRCAPSRSDASGRTNNPRSMECTSCTFVARERAREWQAAVTVALHEGLALEAAREGPALSDAFEYLALGDAHEGPALGDARMGPALGNASEGPAFGVAHYDPPHYLVTHTRHGRSRSARTMAKPAKSRRHWQHAASNDAVRALEERTDASRCELQACVLWRLAAALTAGFVLAMHVRTVLCAHRTARAFLIVQMLPNIA